MRTSNFFWGAFILALGVSFLLYNLDMFTLTPGSIFYLWPTLIIIWGISFFKINKKIKAFLNLLAGGFLGLLLVSLLNMNLNINKNFHWSINKTFGNKSTKINSLDLDSNDINKFTIEYSPSFEKAELKFDAGTGVFNFQELSDKLLDIETNNDHGDLRSFIIDSSKMDIKFELENLDNVDIEKTNKVRFKMHPNPVWDFDLDIGAPKLDMDLSAFKVRNLLIDGGAADITVKFGDFYDKTNVDMDLGVSNILLMVPKTSGVYIVSSSAITSSDMDDFIKVEDDQYRTENWKTADKTININIDCAISKIQVIRYE